MLIFNILDLFHNFKKQIYEGKTWECEACKNNLKNKAAPK